MTSFTNWLDTFVLEKGIDENQIIEVEGTSATNLIPVGCLVDLMKQAPKSEQAPATRERFAMACRTAISKFCRL